MKPLLSLVDLIPGGQKLAAAFSFRRRSRRLARIGDQEAVFTHIFEANKWNNEESRSGFGSTLEYTQALRKEMAGLLRRYDIKLILDAPCGDYNWFQHVDRNPGISYIGGDIVRPLIKGNRAKFEDESTRFVHMDITRDRLPDADIWVCRDCWFHLSNKDILSAIRMFLDSNIPYLLTSTHSECLRNSDIPTGHFRLLNLQQPPFNFCAPEICLDDWIKGFPVKSLALWRRADILTNSWIQG